MKFGGCGMRAVYICFREIISAWKIMCTGSWNRKWIFVFLPDKFCNIFCGLKKTALCNPKKTQDLSDSCGWEQLDHPLYSPDHWLPHVSPFGGASRWTAPWQRWWGQNNLVQWLSNQTSLSTWYSKVGCTIQ